MCTAPSSLATNMHMFKNPPVDAGKAIQVVTQLNRQSFMLMVANKSPLKSIADIVALGKQKGDKMSYATTAPTGQVSGFLFKKILGLQAVEVNYRTGADTLADIEKGHVDYAFHDPVLAIAQAKAGTMRIIGVTTKERMKALPDVPSLHELGVKDLDVPGWWGAMVPMATPKPIVDKLHKMFVAVTSTEETKKFFNQFGADPVTSSSPEAAQKQLLGDIEIWGRHINDAGIPKQG